MSQYAEGSVDVASGSSTVNGISTAFSTNVSPGNIFVVDGDAVYYKIASAPDATTLQLVAPYGGTTKTGVQYAIYDDFTPQYSIPLLSPGDLESWVAFNEMALIVDRELALGGGGGGGGAGQLVDLSDVSSAGKTNRFVLVANGTTYAGRLLTRLDVSDLLPIAKGDLSSATQTLIDGSCDEIDYLGATIGGASTANNANNSIPLGALAVSIWTGSSGWTAKRTLTLTGSAREKQTFTFGNNSGFAQTIQGANVNTPNGSGVAYDVPNGAVALFKSEGLNGRIKLEGLFSTSGVSGGTGGGGEAYDPKTDAGNYSSAPFQLTDAIATSGQVHYFINTSQIKINVQAGIAKSEWGFHIRAGNTGQLLSPAGVKIDELANRGGAAAALNLAPGFHVLQRLEAADEWEHVGPRIDEVVLFHGPVGGHRINGVPSRDGSSGNPLLKADSGHHVDLYGTSAIPTDVGWQAILFAAGGASRTITHAQFRRASDGAAIGGSYVIAADAAMSVLVKGSACYLMGL